MFPDDNVATATFCRWPVDHGSELGIEGRLCVPASAETHARMNDRGLPFRRLRMVAYWYLLVLPRRLWQLWSARRDDVAFVQRGLLHPKSRPVLERLLARFGPPIAYHLDDALWVLRPEGYRRRVELATMVITGTEAVAAYARSLGAEVSVVEYPVEAERYPVREQVEGDPIRIGWTGARPEEYLPPVLPVLLDVCRSRGARLKVVSGRRRPALGAIDEFLDWEPWTPEGRFEALADVDIAILPLEESELHRGKEPFKLKEYMAWGLPVVASPVGHVQRLIADGREGFFARDEAEWRDRLNELIDDRALRARMGADGRALVAEAYRYDERMEELLAVLRAVARAST